MNCSNDGKTNFQSRALGWMLLMVLDTCLAQTGIWPIATLHPPGLDAEATAVADVALAGDYAVTAYAPSPTMGYRVYVRKRTAQGWGAPQLLAQGQPGAGEMLDVDGDSNYIAIGLPKADGNGRVDIYQRSGEVWALQQSIPAAPSAGPFSGTMQNFGSTVTLKRSLLLVTSFADISASQFDTYRLDTGTGSWIAGGYSVWNGLAPRINAKTDGIRVVFCSAACGVKRHDGAGQWVGEGATPSNFLAIAGDWYFAALNGELAVYRRGETTWQLHQQLGAFNTLSVVDGRLILGENHAGNPRLRVYQVDANGIWQLGGSFDSPSMPSGWSTALAINDTFALSGIQSFADTGNGSWLPSGAIEGATDARSQGFGASVVLAANHAWVGSPYYNGDVGSGAVWMEPLDGNSQTVPRNLDAPSFAATETGFGYALSTDGVRVAVASLHHSGYLVAQKVRIYGAAAISPPLATLTLPVTLDPVWKVDVAIDGDTMAVLRSTNGGNPSEIFVYRVVGSAYGLVQTIVLPSGIGGLAYSQNVELSGDWLLAGGLQYRRVGNGNYTEVGVLSYPAGVVANFVKMNKSGNWMIVPPAYVESGAPLARIFALDVNLGWIYSGNLLPGAFVGSDCSYVAISDGLVACVESSSLHLAVPDPVGNNWTIVNSLEIPGTAPVGGTQNTLSIEGRNVMIGLPGDRKAVVLSVSEDIFRSGFQ